MEVYVIGKLENILLGYFDTQSVTSKEVVNLISQCRISIRRTERYWLIKNSYQNSSET